MMTKIVLVSSETGFISYLLLVY